jgi:hypothetical protein
MACRVAHSPVVRLWMADRSICKHLPVERWSSYTIYGRICVSLSFFTGNTVGCWSWHMPGEAALERLGKCSHNAAFREASR